MEEIKKGMIVRYTEEYLKLMSKNKDEDINKRFIVLDVSLNILIKNFDDKTEFTKKRIDKYWICGAGIDFEETISKSNLIVEEILNKSFKVNVGEEFGCLCAPEDMIFLPKRIVENFREEEDPQEAKEGIILIFKEEE